MYLLAARTAAAQTYSLRKKKLNLGGDVTPPRTMNLDKGVVQSYTERSQIECVPQHAIVLDATIL